MEEIQLPDRLEDLTPGWLTRALRKSGVLGDERVNMVKAEILGDGEGFLGDLARLHLEYEPSAPSAPRTMIAKLPTTRRKNRGMGELLGAYEREILFYGELASELPLRVPQTYYADLDPGSDSEYETRMAGKIDSMPIWILRLIMILVTWMTARRYRRYVLLLEDLSSGEIGDQVAGCSQERAEQLVRAIARVHAQHWNSPELESTHWLRRIDLNPRTMHGLFLDNVAAFRERFECGQEASALLDYLAQHGATLVRHFSTSTPHTLQHCDMRLDNVFFFPAEEAREGGAAESGRSDEEIAAVFDWQLTGRGPGIYDVAYFLSGALPSETPTEVSGELVRAYHAELLANGVEDYSFEDCLLGYHQALLIVLQRIATTDAMEMGDGRGNELIRLWSERLYARMSGVDLATLIA